MKKVSLILTTFNSRENLKKTLDSIAMQNYENIEVVIKDGKSEDGTVELIKDYSKNYKYPIVWESVADSGIYEAMNQGYGISTGDIIAFFNDEFLSVDAVQKYVMAIETPGMNYIGAHSDLVYMHGNRVVRKWHMGNGEIKQGWMPGHLTLYLKRAIYEKYGLYDTSYRISADYEFMIRFLKNPENKLAYIPETLVAMFYGGTSNSTFLNYLESLKEGHAALVRNKIHGAWLIDMKRTVRVLKQFQ